MFLIRSAFWLTVAFVALHPRDLDLGAAATSVANDAMAAGQQVIVSQIAANSCLVVRCEGSARVPGSVVAPPAAEVASILPSSTISATPAIIAVKPVFPRPRPAWMS